MKSPLSYQARRELVERMAPQYQAASRTQKMLLLDTFVALTGYVRKYAVWLLNHPVESRPKGPPARPVHYGSEVQQALYQAWRAANQICTKRLMPFLPTLVETRVAWTSPPQREVPEPTALDECSDSRSAFAFPTTTRSSRDIHYPSRNAPQTPDPDPHLR